jgi:hypothetical protein
VSSLTLGQGRIYRNSKLTRGYLEQQLGSIDCCWGAVNFHCNFSLLEEGSKVSPECSRGWGKTPTCTAILVPSRRRIETTRQPKLREHQLGRKRKVHEFRLEYTLWQGKILRLLTCPCTAILAPSKRIETTRQPKILNC